MQSRPGLRDWLDGEIGVDRHPAEVVQPERRLMRAVLEDAIRTLLNEAQAMHRRAIRLRQEALAWIRSKDRSDLFAFDNICEALGIDAGWLRAEVLAREPSPSPAHTE